MPPPELGLREGHLEGHPELPSLTHEGEPLASSSSPGPTPMALFTWASAFVPEAQMGTRQGAIWSSPKTLKPHSQCLACLTPITPFFSAPWVFICVYCLSIRQPQYPAHRKPTSQAWRPGGPLPCLSFPLGWGTMGRGGSQSPLQLSDHGHCLFAVNGFPWTIAGTPGVGVGARREGGQQVPASEGWAGGSGAQGPGVWLSQVM